MTNNLAEAVRAQAAQLGFNLVGITPAKPSPTLAAYQAWVEAGMYGEMGYLARPDRQARRQDLNVIVPNVRSLIIVALDYRTQPIPASLLNDPSRGRIAAYAWGIDYHDLMTPRLQELANWLQAHIAVPVQQRVYVDTGAILERSHAQQAGLGFIGKNTMLISPRRGSFFFLGEILTTYEFADYDQPAPTTMCGSCSRCLQACPTKAFPKPHVLDARRCISYLTIEYKGSIARELRPQMANWIVGCDVCQDVCPWQRFGVQSQESAFFPIDYDRAAPPLDSLLTLDAASFSERYGDAAISRLKRDRLVRNACVAAGNWRDPVILPLLAPLLHDASSMVREHAAWAIGRNFDDSAVALLQQALQTETEPSVRNELQQSLQER